MRKKEEDVYQHLFFGNPYLPYGVYHMSQEKKANEKTKKKT